MLGKMKSQGGFTLVELMVCIAIIGILSAIAIPNYIRYRERSKVARAQADLETIALVINMLAMDSGLYPTGDRVADYEDGGSELHTLNGDEFGITGADGDFLADADGWAGPYMKVVPQDPWGNEYWFDSDWHNNEDGWDYVAVCSLGPNGVGFNDYDDPDNICNIISDPFVDP